MSCVVLWCILLLTADQPGATQPAPDLAAYEAAKSRAGSDPDANVRLALWCEAHGMEAERRAHLAAAVQASPAQAGARGLMGLVVYRGDWKTPDALARQVKDDALLARYNAERDRTPETADGHWKLALWCEAQGLKAEATAHLTAVTQLAPGRTDAWHRLGCKPFKGRWLNPEQFAAEEAEAKAQQKADRHWEPQLETWKNQWRRGGTDQDKVEAAFAQIHDPHSVPAIRRVFSHESPQEQLLAIKMLVGIRGSEASLAIAVFSVHARSPQVRQTAIDELKARDPRDYVGALIASLQKPLNFRVRPVGPNGEPGVLEMENEAARSRRIYQIPNTLIANSAALNGFVGYDVFGKPSVMPRAQVAHLLRSDPAEQYRNLILGEEFAEALERKAQQRTESTLSRDVSTVEKHNRDVMRANLPVLEVLNEVTDQRIGDDPDKWRTWWYDQRGYHYEPYTRTTVKTTVHYVPINTNVRSCFAAGTPVFTLTGPRPIEQLRIGDLVLSQDTRTGGLSYEPVIGLHHNPPMTTLRLRLGEEEIVSTTHHRFWRTGQGWAMARELSPRDILRTLGGRIEIAAIKDGPAEPVFNLDVAHNCTYFVGKAGFLVHDNSLPPSMLTPFDAEPVLERVGHDMP